MTSMPILRLNASSYLMTLTYILEILKLNLFIQFLKKN